MKTNNNLSSAMVKDIDAMKTTIATTHSINNKTSVINNDINKRYTLTIHKNGINATLENLKIDTSNIIDVVPIDAKTIEIITSDTIGVDYYKTKKNNYTFNDCYSSFEEFITIAPTSITKGIVKGFVRTLHKVRDKENSTPQKTVYKYITNANYESAKKIVDSGYQDAIFDDLCQETALCLIQNSDRIIIDNSDGKNHYIIDNDLMLDICKCIRKYLWNNTQKQSNKEFCVMELELGKDSEGNKIYYEVDARVESKEYKNYLIEECEKTFVPIEKIIKNIAIYVYYETNKVLKYDTLVNVLWCMVKGTPQKDSGIPNNTFYRYKKAIKDNFSKFMKWDFVEKFMIENEELKSENKGHYDYINIDYSGLSLNTSTLEELAQSLEELAQSLDNSRVKTAHQNDHKLYSSHMAKWYNKELQLDRR